MNKVLFALVSVFIQLPVSLVLALILARGIKGENFYRSVYFLPVIISTVVIGQLVCVTISVISSLKIFDLIYVLTNGGPAHASELPWPVQVWTAGCSGRSA